VSNLSQAALGAVEASFADIADGLLDTESLIEAAYMAASSIEEEIQQSAMKRLLDVIQDKTREIRKAFENKHGNPIYRQKALEEAKTEAAAKERRNVKEVQPREDDPAASPVAADILRVYDVLTLTRGLFDAASEVRTNVFRWIIATPWMPLSMPCAKRLARPRRSLWKSWKS
jgi:hypothetical protein